MSRFEQRASDRARRILQRLAESTDSLDLVLDESESSLTAPKLAERLHQIEQVFLLHGGERSGASGPDPDQILFEWGHLQIVEKLGHGSFGEVYRAYDRILDRQVALKLLKTDHDRPFQSQLFLHEARQLAMVRHRNVLAVHGAAVHEGRPGLWTDLIAGATAHNDQQRESVVQTDQALELIESMALALQAVHSAGLVHGDIKPANIMRDASGVWILMDFGASLDHRSTQQAPPMTSGTPLYMAPEVVLGQPPSTESDLYSLGATLYRVLVGQAPIEANDWSELRAAHTSGQTAPSTTSATKLDRRIARLIDELMSRLPEQRPRLDDALNRVQSIREAPQRRFRRVAVSSIAGLLILGLTFTSIGFYQANEARIQAEREQRNTSAVNDFLQRVLATPSTTGRARDLTVEDMLLRAADDVEPYLQQQPAAQAVVHTVLAESFNTLRRTDQAEAQIDFARQLLAGLDEPMPAIERGLELQAVRTAELDNRHEDSIAMATRFIASHRHELDGDHPDLRWAEMYRVTNHLALGQNEQAHQLLQAHFQHVPEPETADSHFGYEILQAWANLHRVQGRYEESVQAAERALDWLDRYPLSRPINRLSALTNLALNLTHSGQPERAIEVLQDMLTIRERMFGAGSGEYVGTLVNLSAMQYDAGRFNDAAATLDSARERILAHPEAVSAEYAFAVSTNLANVLNATGEQARGEALIRELIVEGRQRWSTEKLDVLKLEYNLAELLNQQGRYEEAYPLATATRAKKERTLGATHAFSFLSMDNMAVALAGLGDSDQALDLHERAVSGLAEHVGPDHPFTLLAERNQLASLQRLSPDPISQNRIQMLIQRHEITLGADHPDTEKARALMAEAR